MFRPPYLLALPIAPTRGGPPSAARAYTPRNEQIVTFLNCGIATRLNRTTVATGLPPARLRPCRPLPPDTTALGIGLKEPLKHL